MKTVYLAAALLLAGHAAHAGSSIAFDFDGRKIRITAPSNCQSLSCLQISGLSGINLNGLKSGKLDDDDGSTASAPPAPAPAPTAAAPAAVVPQAQANAAQPAAPAAALPVAPVTAPAPFTPEMPANAAAPTAPAAAVAPAPVAGPAPQPVAAAPASDPNSPVGLWATEDNKGNVRIEQCGLNLCGYAEKSNEKILINMKPKENKWVGRIHDPDGGGNYDSTIALKGTSTLKVQGCAFGGLFCGGQTWKRVG
jgi:uncharacterized protein (DUF2147 family)